MPEHRCLQSVRLGRSPLPRRVCPERRYVVPEVNDGTDGKVA